ncbi:MAG TPA: hypothetical protein VFF72_06510 [Caldimonas sp.]|nr:hypothetical protein [Caldimonas sp.]
MTGALFGQAPRKRRAVVWLDRQRVGFGLVGLRHSWKSGNREFSRHSHRCSSQAEDEACRHHAGATHFIQQQEVPEAVQKGLWRDIAVRRSRLDNGAVAKSTLEIYQSTP